MEGEKMPTNLKQLVARLSFEEAWERVFADATRKDHAAANQLHRILWRSIPEPVNTRQVMMVALGFVGYVLEWQAIEDLNTQKRRRQKKQAKPATGLIQ
jgi:hypothetical protein